MSAELRLGTRRSPLALCQAEQVRALIASRHPDQSVRLVPMVSEGDRRQDLALHELGGKGVFLKELEQALSDGQIDLAVHSLKDMPAQMPADLMIAAIPERAEPNDVLVAATPCDLTGLEAGARVGTGSLRRRCQLGKVRPDLIFAPIRGNIGTRLGKLDSGEFDALVLAEAGLSRLGLGERISARLSVEICLPAAGQGALAVQTRAEDTELNALLDPLNHPATAACCYAERAVLAALECGCHAPVAAFAEISGDQMRLRARVGNTDCSELIEAEQTGKAADAQTLGEALARELLRLGAAALLHP